MSLLEVRGLISGYREGTVLHGVDLDLDEGQVLAVLGRNGMGKSTLMHTIMGLVRPSAGTVRVAGRDLARHRPDVIARAGVALVPQGRRVFAPVTVDEQLRLAARAGRSGRWTLAAVYDQLPRLRERLQHRGDQLSGGEQQMLAIGRALLANPTVLLLDEPSDGLAPIVVGEVGEIVQSVCSEGVTVLLVEQDLHLAFSLAGSVAVMSKGQIVHRADTDAFRRDPATARRLLGVG
jgi:branched-chain amino acid transport system ATP-binding protein